MAETVVRGGDGRPRLRKANKQGWSAAKAKAFLGHLRISCNVAASCRKAEVSDGVVYSRRKTDAAFRAEWAAAIAEAVERLEMMLLERAMKGTPVERRARDGAVVKTVQYPDQVALALIRAHKDHAEAHEAPDDETELAALRIKIGRKLDAVAKRERKAEEEARAHALGLADEARGSAEAKGSADETKRLAYEAKAGGAR